MKVAIYGRRYEPDFSDYLKIFFDKLREYNYEITIYQDFYEFIKSESDFDPEPDQTFTGVLKKENQIDIVFSIGGDGTFLETVTFVRDTDIPIVGINSGRLGFLANISRNELAEALDSIHNQNFTIEERSLIKVESDNSVFNDYNCALNEITVQKRDSGSMITIQVYANDKFLNSYRADGLIIATPTGSTAYSLSVGGPIVVPGSNNFIITPIAPHNLTVRPIVIPNNNVLKIKIEGRNKNYLASLDYRSEILNTKTSLTVRTAPYSIKIVKFENKSFFDILRNKLMWGFDKRN